MELLTNFTVSDCSVITFPKIHNRAGNITPLQNLIDIPFSIKRVFYTYDIPGGEDRGAHAHRELHQLVIAASGCFDVHLDDGVNKRTVQLNRPYYGLHIKPGIWAHLGNFSSGSICLALVSDIYKESDYIRNYHDYLLFKGKTSSI